MRTPDRSAAIAKVLALQADGLPKDFPAQVAALAEARASARYLSLNDLALLGAFVLMIGVCVAGWLLFDSPEPGGVEWFAPIVRAVTSQPWLVLGVAGVAVVQMLTFRRRATL